MEENFETKIAKESRVQFHNPIGVFRRKMGNKYEKDAGQLRDVHVLRI